MKLMRFRIELVNLTFLLNFIKVSEAGWGSICYVNSLSIDPSQKNKSTHIYTIYIVRPKRFGRCTLRPFSGDIR